MTNKQVEDLAIQFVLTFERAAGRPATDVRYTGADGDVQSSDRIIEVKAYGASARGTDLWLEARQYEAARAHPAFWLYVVDNVRQGDPAQFGLIQLGGTALAGLLTRAKEQRTYIVPFPVAEYDQRRRVPGGVDG